MNILREVRRVKNRSMPIRIILLLTFCVIFIVTTYAWFSTLKNVKFGGLHGEVTPWDVSYYIKADGDRNESQVLDETFTFTIDEFYPGMPSRQDLVHIYNLGGASSEISYDLISVKIFGNEILKKDAYGNLSLEVHNTNADGEEVIEEVDITSETTSDGIQINVFSADTAYPFKISYTYDKTKLIGAYVDGNANKEKAHGKLTFEMSWTYEGDLDKDTLDTKFGKNAYTYYKDGNNKTKAVEVMVRIKSTMVHPSVDPDYVEN